MRKVKEEEEEDDGCDEKEGRKKKEGAGFYVGILALEGRQLQ